MQGLSKSNTAVLSTTRPLEVVDAATLVRVAGGLGPHGGWSTPVTTAALDATAVLGPHGGWVTAALGPHGGW